MHWALKLAQNLPTNVVQCFFSTDFGCTFHFLTEDGECFQLELGFVYNCVRGKALSVDGGMLQVVRMLFMLF